jgi:signal transduction histidine kinase
VTKAVFSKFEIEKPQPTMKNRYLTFFGILLLLAAHVGKASLQAHRIDSLKSLLPTHPDKARLYNDVAFEYEQASLFDSSFRYANLALTHVPRHAPTLQAYRAYHTLGLCYQNFSFYYDALRYFENAHLVAIALKNVPFQVESLHRVGLNFWLLGINDKSIEYQRKAIALNNQWADKRVTVKALNIIGLCHFGTKNYNQALYYFIKSNQLAGRIHDRWGLAASHKNIGRALFEVGKVELGTRHLYRSIQLLRQPRTHDELHTLTLAQLQLARFSMKTNAFEPDNIPLLNRVFSVVKLQKWNEEAEATASYLYQYYQHYGQKDSALHYLEISRDYAQIVTQQWYKTQEVAYHERTEKEHNEEKMAEMRAEANQREWQLKMLFTGLGCLLFFSGIILWLYRKIGVQKKLIESYNVTLQNRVYQGQEALVVANNEIKEATYKGQTFERKRVAAELHDNLGSLLSAITLSMEAFQTGKMSEKEQQIFHSIQNLLDDAYREVRFISHNLQPQDLEQQGIAKTLNRLADQLNATQQLKLTTYIGQLPDFPKEVEIHLYSICLELLNNILKHSHASKAVISLQRGIKNSVRLIVSDNGIGLQTLTTEGIGLKNIQSRCQSIKAVMRINHGLPSGTTFQFTVPLG